MASFFKEVPVDPCIHCAKSLQQMGDWQRSGRVEGASGAHFPLKIFSPSLLRSLRALHICYGRLTVARGEGSAERIHSRFRESSWIVRYGVRWSPLSMQRKRLSSENVSLPLFSVFKSPLFFRSEIFSRFFSRFKLPLFPLDLEWLGGARLLRSESNLRFRILALHTKVLCHS